MSLRENLSEYAHEAWSGWMGYLFSKCRKGDEIMTDGTSELIIPSALVARWERQMTTNYADLPEYEQKSDRKEADRIIAIVKSSYER